MSATTDLIIRYQSASPVIRRSMRAQYPGYFAEPKSCKRCRGTGTVNSRKYGLVNCSECAGYGEVAA